MSHTPDIFIELTIMLYITDPIIPPNCIIKDESDRIDERFSSGISEFMIVPSGIFIMPLIMNKNR